MIDLHQSSPKRILRVTHQNEPKTIAKPKQLSIVYVHINVEIFSPLINHVRFSKEGHMNDHNQVEQFIMK